MYIMVLFIYIITHVGDNVSDRSTSSWIIVGISTGVILLITSVTTLLCLLLRKRKPKNKTL